ncbi:hypothetical protein OPV22_023018 [Ensete ventricosum]|uniref:Uncharacterized protein n=1 Tax=Ensete ventricosum TaxID=4639 RepID=A0AAV8QKZ6_ENSVE|nr:hypothetical protein OPV22_023018 [Ensete ventricosum]
MDLAALCIHSDLSTVVTLASVDPSISVVRCIQQQGILMGRSSVSGRGIQVGLVCLIAPKNANVDTEYEIVHDFDASLECRRERQPPDRRPSTAAGYIQGAPMMDQSPKKDVPGTQGASGDQSSKKADSRPSDLPGGDCPLDLCGLHPRSVGRSVFQESRFQAVGPPRWRLPPRSLRTAPKERREISLPRKPISGHRTSQAATAPWTCADCTQGAYVDVGDSQMCIPYVSDIYGYLRSREVKLRPLANYLLGGSSDGNHSHTMRKCLVDWMARPGGGMLPSALRYPLPCCLLRVDTSLSSFTVIGPRLQLLGASAIYVLNMEMSILRHLRFDMGSPTVKTFLMFF